MSLDSSNTTNVMPLLGRLIATSLAVSDKSARLVQEIFKHGNLKIEDKGGLRNYQTEADRKIEQLLVGNIEKHFPGVAIVGEEDEVGKIEDDSYWIDYEAALKAMPPVDGKIPDVNPEDLVIWLDPLDGTAEFIDGLLSHVTTLIGIAHKGKALAGVINQPFYKNEDGTMGRSIWGIKGVGAYGFQTKEAKPGRILTTSRSHMDGVVKQCIDAMEPTEILRMGGAGNKVLQLIESNAHAYIFASPGCKKWDTCAPQAILEALGGRLTDVHGNELLYHKDVQKPNKGGVIAAVTNIDFYLDKIPQEIKDKLQP